MTPLLQSIMQQDGIGFSPLKRNMPDQFGKDMYDSSGIDAVPRAEVEDQAKLREQGLVRQGFEAGAASMAPPPPITGASAGEAGRAYGFRRGTARVPGKGNKDTVPAMLTPGEAVLNKGAAKALGRGKIAALNAKHGNPKKTGLRAGVLHANEGLTKVPYPPGYSGPPRLDPSQARVPPVQATPVQPILANEVPMAPRGPAPTVQAPPAQSVLDARNRILNSRVIGNTPPVGSTPPGTGIPAAAPAAGPAPAAAPIAPEIVTPQAGGTAAPAQAKAGFGERAGAVVDKAKGLFTRTPPAPTFDPATKIGQVRNAISGPHTTKIGNVLPSAGKTASSLGGLVRGSGVAALGEGAVRGLNTTTDEYAQRTGIEAPQSVAGQLALRGAGVLSDVGASVINAPGQLAMLAPNVLKHGLNFGNWEQLYDYRDRFNDVRQAKANPVAAATPVTEAAKVNAQSGAAGDTPAGKVGSPEYYDAIAAKNGMGEERAKGQVYSQFMNDKGMKRTLASHGAPVDVGGTSQQNIGVITSKDGHKTYTNAYGLGSTKGETPEAAAAAKQASKDFWEQNARIDEVADRMLAPASLELARHKNRTERIDAESKRTLNTAMAGMYDNLPQMRKAQLQYEIGKENADELPKRMKTFWPGMEKEGTQDYTDAQEALMEMSRRGIDPRSMTPEAVMGVLHDTKMQQKLRRNVNSQSGWFGKDAVGGVKVSGKSQPAAFSDVFSGDDVQSNISGMDWATSGFRKQLPGRGGAGMKIPITDATGRTIMMDEASLIGGDPELAAYINAKR